MAPETPQLGVIQSESSQTMGGSSNAPLTETQLQRRYQLVHWDAAIAATENMALDAHLKKVLNTGPSVTGVYTLSNLTKYPPILK